MEKGEAIVMGRLEREPEMERVSRCSGGKGNGEKIGDGREEEQGTQHR